MANDFPSGPFVRTKQTDPDQVMRPVAELIEGKSTRQRHVDLQGNEVLLDFSSLVVQDPWPIPLPVDREGYYSIEDSHYYWSSGYMDWSNVNGAIREFSLSPPRGTEKLKLLDVGCSTGRFLRHVCAFAESEFDIYGADFCHQNIDWLSRHLPQKIRAFMNTAIPHLPFPDHYFDVITGFSFMPHLGHLEDAWLPELRRITKRNGLMYLTIANESTWLDSINRESTLASMLRSNDIPGNKQMERESFEQEFLGSRFVRQTSTDPVYNCYVWHKNSHIRSAWSRYVDVRRIIDFAHLRHQAVVLATPQK